MELPAKKQEKTDRSTSKSRYSFNDFKVFENACLFVQHTYVSNKFLTHTHDFNETVIVLSGHGVHIVESREYPLSKGHVFAIKGNVSHGFKDADHLEVINLMYDTRVFLRNKLELYSIPGFFPLFVIEPELRSIDDYPFQLKLDDKMLQYVKMMSQFIIDRQNLADPEQETVIQLSFLALVSYLATQYNSNTSDLNSIKTVSRACAYIDSKFNQSLSIGDISKSLMISERHLERLFKEYLNQTPMEYLKHVRLNHALSLLIQQNLSVNETAAKSGFSDPCYFTRVFREYFGVLPHMAKKLISDRNRVANRTE